MGWFNRGKGEKPASAKPITKDDVAAQAKVDAAARKNAEAVRVAPIVSEEVVKEGGVVVEKQAKHEEAESSEWVMGFVNKCRFCGALVADADLEQHIGEHLGENAVAFFEVLPIKRRA